jgi:hypothetical protein
MLQQIGLLLVATEIGYGQVQRSAIFGGFEVLLWACRTRLKFCV